jgi:predicted transcriptional regulator
MVSTWVHATLYDDCRVKQRLQVLASVDDRDRRRFVGEALEARLRGTGSRGLRDAIRSAAAIELPETPTDARVETWLELAEMVGDPSFLERHRANGSRNVKLRFADMPALCRPASEAVARGVSPEGTEGRAIVGRWVTAMLRRQRRPWRGRIDARAHGTVRFGIAR